MTLNLIQRGYSLVNHLTRSSFIRQSCRFKSSTSSSSVDSNGNPLTSLKLSKPIPDFPRIVYPLARDEGNETKVTTLENGLRVASQPRFGQFCTVGVIINSGSRYEVNFTSGISHFLEKLSFQSTESYKSREDIWSDLEKHGGICDCQGSRDTLIYAASIDSRGLDAAIKIISEAVYSPNILDHELESARQTIQFELLDHTMRPDQEQTLLELIHKAAFSANTLGLPRLCPQENISKINRDVLMSYIKTYHTPDRIVLAGVGVDHDRFVDLANKYFVDVKPIWEKDETIGKLGGNIVPDKSLAQYTGGLATLDRDLSTVNQGFADLPELAHIILGFESSSHQMMEDFIPICVLNMMMGGGGSFSAGGPGKGMYTRLYTNVLNRHHWMFNATAYNHAYTDSGVFCIHASAHPSQLQELVNVIVSEAVGMTAKISPTELKRAKTQLQSMLLMNLEARPVVFEDIARQVLANGFRRPPQYFIEAINKVTEDDIIRVAERMLKSKVSLAALGNLKSLPSLKDVELSLTNKENRFKRFSVFS
ncbi:mitochondrial-processing peptidase subunit alpha-like [Panonychus citri]|uniref:mitochondrial-processing peptidase subunit alpha-like n=1 Tax=Panonychus citri TaxID=50023 RepID=UPI002307D25F|nr:mitochondrial-processing peptidase subunit alpha-like [Panonychus citri]